LWKRQDVPKKRKKKEKKGMRKIIDGNETLGMIKNKRLKNLKKVMVVENVGIESRCKMNYY
jgi:hypothetical protein